MVKNDSWYQSTLAFVQARHQGRVDKLGGWPDYQHFERVADRLIRLFPQATQAQVQAALLHDALEPKGCSIEELLAHGVTAEAIAIIHHISLPQDGRSYLAYIQDLRAVETSQQSRSNSRTIWTRLNLRDPDGRRVRDICLRRAMIRRASCCRKGLPLAARRALLNELLPVAVSACPEESRRPIDGLGCDEPPAVTEVDPGFRTVWRLG